MSPPNRRTRHSDRNKTSTLAKCVGALLVLAALSSCETHSNPLRVGVLAWPPYDLAHLASERGLIDASDFELVNFQTPSEVIRSFRYGLIDAMFVTSHFALSTLREIGDVRIIYIIDVSLGGDALLVKPGFDSAEALDGARIGVETAPLGIYTLVRALGELGLSRDDVDVVNVDTPSQLEAWRNGSVDAVVTYEPTRSMVRREGAIELFNSASIPYEILDVLVVRKTTVDARRGELADLVSALDQALEIYRAAEESTVEMLARRHPLTSAEFRQAMSSVELFGLADNLEMLTNRDHPVLDALEQQCEVMVEAGMLVTAPDLDPILDASVVELAADR